MTGSQENPMHDLMASGLHRLAQPISSALWSVELAEAPATAPLPHVAGEMRRAAGILHVLRSLMEASTSYPELQVEDLAALLVEMNAEVFPQLEKAGVTCSADNEAAPVPARLNAQGFKESYRLLLEKFLWLGITGAQLHQVLTCNADSFKVELICESEMIGRWTKTDRDRLLQELDPFDTPGFDFSSRPAPELTQARAIFASAAIELTAAVTGPAIHFTLQGQIHRQ